METTSELERLRRENAALKQELEDLKLKCDLHACYSSEIIATYTPDSKPVYISPSSYRLMGYEADEFAGKDIFDLVHPEDIDQLLQSIGEARKYKKTYFTNVFRYRHKNGHYIWVESRSHHIYDKNGELQLMIVNNINIDRRKKLELDLTHTKETFRLLAENIEDELWTADLELNLTYVNSYTEKIFGFRPEERVKQSLEELFTPESLEKVRQVFTHHLDQLQPGKAVDKTIVLELQAYHKDGRIITIETKGNFIFNENSEPVGLVGITRDITEQRRLERNLRASEERFRSIVNSLPQLVAYVDKDLRYQFANDTYENFFGIKREEIKGKKLIDIIGEKAYKKAKFHLEKVFRGKTVHYREYYEYLYGKPRHIDGHLLPVKDENANITGYYAILNDVSHYMEARKELAESEELHRLVLNNISDAVYLTDYMGNFKFICPNADVIFEYNFREIQKIGNIHKLFNGSFIDLEKIDRATEITNLPKSISTKTGIKKEVLVNIKHVNVKGNSLLITCHDISERVKAYEQLSESEKRYRSLVKNAPIGIGLSRFNTIIFANPYLLKLLGYESVQELTEKSITDLIHPDDLPFINQRMMEVEKGIAQYPFQAELRLYHTDGTYKNVSLVTNSIRHHNSQYTQAIFTDITERRQTERSHRQLTLDTLYINRKNELIEELKRICLKEEVFKALDNESQENISRIFERFADEGADWQIIQKHFEIIHKDFFEKLFTHHSNLTQNELRHCVYIKLNFSTKEIARLLNVLPTSIQIARVRLKKKLGLAQEVNLINYIQGL